MTILVLVISLLLYSCYNKNEADSGSERPYAEKDENVSDLKPMDKKNFIDDAKKSLEEASMRIAEFEADLGSYDELMRREMQSRIQDLKAERDTLGMILEDIDSMVDTSWVHLHSIARDDLEELERSVRSFYNDYFNTDG
jgi:uncharacterized coiled-coil DUF342 family protein